jgi:hypothetical protein
MYITASSSLARERVPVIKFKEWYEFSLLKKE